MTASFLQSESNEFYVALSLDGPCFPAIIEHSRANGWVRPRFRRAVAHAVLAWLNAEYQAGRSRFGSGNFEDEMVVLVGVENEQSRVPVDADGRVALGAGHWPWFFNAPMGDPESDAALLADAERRRPSAQEVLVDVDGEVSCFPAKIDEIRWHGWVIPYFRRAVAEIVVAWVRQESLSCPESAHAYWEGESIVLISPFYMDQDGYLPTRIEPDAEGRYCIGGGEWTWSIYNSPSESEGDR